MDRHNVPEAELDEPMLMAQYLLASGGLWPHLALARTTSSPSRRGPLTAVGASNPDSGRRCFSMTFPLQRDLGDAEAVEPPGEQAADSSRDKQEVDEALVNEGNGRTGQSRNPRFHNAKSSMHNGSQYAVPALSGISRAQSMDPQVRVENFTLAPSLVTEKDSAGSESLLHSPLKLRKSGRKSGLSLLLDASA